MAWRCVQVASAFLFVVIVAADKAQDTPVKRSPQYLPQPPQALGQYVSESQAYHPAEHHLASNNPNHDHLPGPAPFLHDNLDTGNPAGEAHVHVQHVVSSTPVPYAPITIHPLPPLTPSPLSPAVKVNYNGAPRAHTHTTHVAQSLVSNQHHQYEVISDYLPDSSPEPILEHDEHTNDFDDWKPVHVNPEPQIVAVGKEPAHESPVTELYPYNTAPRPTEEYDGREQESVGPREHEIYHENEGGHLVHPDFSHILSTPVSPESEHIHQEQHHSHQINSDDHQHTVHVSYHERDHEHQIHEHVDNDNGLIHHYKQEYHHDTAIDDPEANVTDREPQLDYFSSQHAPAPYAPAALPPRPSGSYYGQAPVAHHAPAAPSHLPNPYIPQPPPYAPPQPQVYQPAPVPQTESYQQTLPLIPIYNAPSEPQSPPQPVYQSTPKPASEYPSAPVPERPYNPPVTSPVPPSNFNDEYGTATPETSEEQKEVQVPAYTPSPNVPSLDQKPNVTPIPKLTSYSTGKPVTVPQIDTDHLPETAVTPVPDADVSGKSKGTAPLAPEESQWTKGSIPYVLEQMGFNTIIDLIILAGLDSQIEKGGPFTIFAPTDAAFDFIVERQGGLDKATENYNKNPEILDSLMKHHVAPGIIPINAMYTPHFLTQSLVGAPLRGKTFIVEDNDWKPQQVLTINGARLIRGDIKATNGIIHIIDRVMAPVPQADIFRTLKADPEGRFTTLTSIIEKTGLLPVLANPRDGPYTIFAPTNKAFSLISKADLNAILYDPVRLNKLLLRHVVKDVIYTSGLQSFQKAYALDYELLYIYHMKGMTKVNAANFVDLDITTLNGIIHPIDSVLGL